MERGIACAPGSLSVVKEAIVAVRRVRRFSGSELRSESKFHVSVGNSTVHAEVVFFGARELLDNVDGNTAALLDEQIKPQARDPSDPPPPPPPPFPSIFQLQKSYLDDISTVDQVEVAEPVEEGEGGDLPPSPPSGPS